MREIPKTWLDRPIGDIRPDDIAKVIEGINQPRIFKGKRQPARLGQAHAMFSVLHRLFSWALGTHKFGLQQSPVADFVPKDLIGEKRVRERVLTNDELKAVWKAAGKVGYPFGDIVKLLMLTGARLNEITQLRWNEIDLNAGLISIPAERMKMRKPFELPITPLMADIIKGIPRQRGPFVFSIRNGHHPFMGFSRAKQELDEASRVTGYVNHDLRRTARTRWSPIASISTEVKEVAMAHRLPGMNKHYNQHDYRDEKRALLTMWEGMLLGIVNPPSDTNVVPIQRHKMQIPRKTMPIRRRPVKAG